MLFLIAFDFDDVLCDFVGTFRTMANERLELEITDMPGDLNLNGWLQRLGGGEDS
jgi:hypothetical protein